MIGYEVMLPIRDHAEAILPWINDQETLSQSFHQSKREPEPFFEEFRARYFTSPRFPSVFILVDGLRAGYLRFQEGAHSSVEISICMAPSFRGKKIASQALLGIEPLLKANGADTLVAEIKKDNIPSLKAFLAADFTDPIPTQKLVFDSQEWFEIIQVTKTLMIKPQQKVFIVAEAGSNWRLGTKKRDLEMAKTLIEVAKESGADAVKFQTYRPETIYVSNAGVSGYLADAGILEEITTLFEDLKMPYEMIKELSDYARLCSIEFMSTPFSENDFYEVDPYVNFHKIASYENGHVHLIKLAAESKKPVFLSTGATSADEIAWTVSYFKECGGSDLTLLQCTAKYPADKSIMNLSSLIYLKERYRCKIGLSDHSQDPLIAPVMATALGASVIEKHFTLSQRLPGPDHAFAMMPDQLKEMVRAIREAESMKGYGYKSILPEEEELKKFAKRGLQALTQIDIGDPFKEGVNYAILRPGNQTQGVHPRFIEQIEGKKAQRKILPGSGILLGDW